MRDRILLIYESLLGEGPFVISREERVEETLASSMTFVELLAGISPSRKEEAKEAIRRLDKRSLAMIVVDEHFDRWESWQREWEAAHPEEAKAIRVRLYEEHRGNEAFIAMFKAKWPEHIAEILKATEST